MNTPRTDAAMIHVIPNLCDHPDAIYCVRIEFVRQLERELAEAKRDNASLAERLTAAELKRDELGARAERAEASELAHAKIACQARIDAERAEAELKELGKDFRKAQATLLPKDREIAQLKAARVLNKQIREKLEADNARLRAELDAARVVKESVGKLTEFISSLSPIHAGKRSTETAISEIKRLMADNARLRAALEKHENAARENLISARIIEAENKRSARCYGITRDCRFITERTEAAIAQARAALGEDRK